MHPIKVKITLFSSKNNSNDLTGELSFFKMIHAKTKIVKLSNFLIYARFAVLSIFNFFTNQVLLLIIKKNKNSNTKIDSYYNNSNLELIPFSVASTTL